MEIAVWAFIGTIVGALASIGTTLISNWNTFRIQKASKEEDRKERARAFQRQTVLELQEELIDYVRLYALSYLERLESFKDTDKWGGLITDKLDEKIRLSNSKTAVLIERVMDNEIRSQLDELKTMIWNGIKATTKKDADLYQEQVIEKFNECNKILGTLLRSNY